MVMVSARLTRRWRLSYRHDIGERRHRRPARRLVAVRRRAVLVVTERQPRRSSQRFVGELRAVPAYDAGARFIRLRRARTRRAGRTFFVADVEVHDQRVELLALGPVFAGHVAHEDVSRDVHVREDHFPGVLEERVDPHVALASIVAADSVETAATKFDLVDQDGLPAAERELGKAVIARGDKTVLTATAPTGRAGLLDVL